MTELWQEVLGLDRVGIHDDFFELGGHSLLALQFLARLRQASGVDLQLKSMLEAASPATLAALIEALSPDGAQPAEAEQGVMEGSL